MAIIIPPDVYLSNRAPGLRGWFDHTKHTNPQNSRFPAMSLSHVCGGWQQTRGWGSYGAKTSSPGLGPCYAVTPLLRYSVCGWPPCLSRPPAPRYRVIPCPTAGFGVRPELAEGFRPGKK